MAVNKVIYGDTTLVDLTQDSVNEDNLLEGETAHDASGNPVTGTAKQGHEIENSAGTKLTQRDVMQVSDGLEAVDDSTNQKTKIKMNLPILSSADWNAMTEQEKTAYKASHYRFGVEVPDTEGVINAEYMKLLWENPNTTQAFAAQTITLNSADYDFLMVIYSAYDGNANAYVSVITPKGKGCILSLTTGYRGNENIRTRQITYVSDTSLSIGDGYLGQASSTVNNTSCIPIAIYGIKKNFQFKVNAIATDLSTSADHCMLSDNETSVEDYITTVSRETIRTDVVLERYGKYRRLAMRNISPTSSNGLIATLPEEDRPHQFSTNIVLGVSQSNSLYPCYTNVNPTTGDIQAYYFTPGTTTDSPAPTTMKIYGDIDWLVD